MKTSAKFILLCALAVFSISAARASELPPLSGAWTNGGPYTWEGLKGKVVVLYFYEEG